MSMVFTILGCGSSAGVPRVGQGWGCCDPNNPKNRRRRCSLLVERIGPRGRTAVLVDTSPDLREQLLDADVTRLDGVLFTHEHADHTHGIDDLRPLALVQKKRIDVYLDADTAKMLHMRFGYCFKTPEGSQYPPILSEHRIAAGERVTIDGEGGPIEILPFMQRHGDIESLGFRFGGLAYSCDVNGLAPEDIAALDSLDVWILDALRYKPHPSHFSVEDALEWIARIRPRRAILTNMHTDIDFETLRQTLPPGVEPAHDGLKIELSQ
jgi:phosphoribosyl 1,2-cyclic phosphate phosphodiesterase